MYHLEDFMLSFVAFVYQIGLSVVNLMHDFEHYSKSWRGQDDAMDMADHANGLDWLKAVVMHSLVARF